MSEDHLDLDALADHVAGEGQRAAHLSSCAGCASRLDELATAQAPVTSALAALAAPAIPADVAARLDAALADLAPLPATPVTTLPVRQGFPRWLAAAAAVAVVAGGIGTAVNAQRDRTSVTAGSADATAEAGPVRNETGNDYADRAALAAAVGDLLAGTAVPAPAALSAETRALPAPAAGLPGAAAASPDTASKDAVGGTSGGQAAAAAPADPLAGLRTEAGLADCLRAVLPPEDPDLRPLALDYGSYRGTPALVLVLPGASSDALDVFVVGADCRADNDALLFYASVPAP